MKQYKYTQLKLEYNPDGIQVHYSHNKKQKTSIQNGMYWLPQDGEMIQELFE